MHWPIPAIFEAVHTLLAVFATPLHQAGPIAARDLADFLYRVTLGVQPNRLIARPFCPITAFPIRPYQLPFLFLSWTLYITE
jgi:hypothetical protein